MTRPSRLIAVVGTQTEAGKTWVASRLLAQLRSRGLRVAARKPVQSFAASDRKTDADWLASATGEDPYRVCPRHRWYPLALAPPMAADELGRPRIVLGDLLAEIEWSGGTQVGLVETVGGVFSPLAHDGHSADCLRLLKPDEVVLVADAGLGTINSIRLSIQALDRWNCRVLLNRYDEDNVLHRRNAAWLRAYDGIGALTRVEELCAGGAR